MFDFPTRRDICLEGMKKAYDAGLYGNDPKVLDGSWRALFDDDAEGPTEGSTGPPGGQVANGEESNVDNVGIDSANRDVEDQKESLLPHEDDGTSVQPKRSNNNVIFQSIACVVIVLISMTAGYLVGQSRDRETVRDGFPCEFISTLSIKHTTY